MGYIIFPRFNYKGFAGSKNSLKNLLRIDF